MAELKPVLVVDDDVELTMAMRMVLEENGYTVYTAENGQVALKILSILKNQVGMILLDLMMPAMDGKTLLMMIRDHRHEVARIPVVVTTSLGPDSIEMKAPVRRCLAKPFHLAELVKLAEQFCGPPVRQLELEL